MGICPVCETINDTYKCNNCGFDKSKDYIHYRSICLLTENERKNFRTGWEQELRQLHKEYCGILKNMEKEQAILEELFRKMTGD